VVVVDTEPHVFLELGGHAHAVKHADQLNALALGQDRERQRVRRAEVVTRTRWVYTDGSEYAEPWLPPAKPDGAKVTARPLADETSPATSNRDGSSAGAGCRTIPAGMSGRQGRPPGKVTER
jgi:hypothetical protein